MKLILSLMFFACVHGMTEWTTDFEKARTEAIKSHKLIVLNFSGSDWCGPCIRMEKEIFESDAFQKYAEQNLLLVKADFPRLKKNQLSKEQTQVNESLADKYNPEGKFPFTILFDEKGKVLKEWVGCPNESPEKFVSELSSVSHAATSN